MYKFHLSFFWFFLILSWLLLNCLIFYPLLSQFLIDFFLIISYICLGNFQNYLNHILCLSFILFFTKFYSSVFLFFSKSNFMTYINVFIAGKPKSTVPRSLSFGIRLPNSFCLFVFLLHLFCISSLLDRR